MPAEQSSAGSSQHSVLTGANTAANSSLLLQAGKGGGQREAAWSMICFVPAIDRPPAAKKSSHAACAGSSTAAQPALQEEGMPAEQSSAGSSQHSVLTGANTAANSSLLVQEGTPAGPDGVCPLAGSVGGAGGPTGAGTTAPSAAQAAAPSSLKHPTSPSKNTGSPPRNQHTQPATEVAVLHSRRCR